MLKSDVHELEKLVIADENCKVLKLFPLIKMIVEEVEDLSKLVDDIYPSIELLIMEVFDSRVSTIGLPKDKKKDEQDLLKLDLVLKLLKVVEAVADSYPEVEDKYLNLVFKAQNFKQSIEEGKPVLDVIS